VYIGIYAEEFGITPNVASGLVSYPNLVYGFGSLLLVPAYLKFGRRPIMIFSMLLFVFGLLGASRSTSYGGLMAARIVHALGSGVCEALPVQLVNDIFFLHERGKRLGFYTVCLCWGSTGPLYAGYMLAGGYSWRLYFYVLVAFAGALLVATVLLVEETHYKRVLPSASPANSVHDLSKDKPSQYVEAVAIVPPRRSYIQQLKPWGTIDHDAEFFMTMVRSFSYFLVPSVLWVITSFGIYIGLGALTFNYTFPLKIVQPPYNWSQTSSGLIALGNVIGYGLAVPLTGTSDRLAARLTRKNGGIREAEMRLGVMLPAMVIGPAGLILYGLAAQNDLHWITYFVGVAMVDWASYFYFTFALAVSRSDPSVTFLTSLTDTPPTVRRRQPNGQHVRNAHRYEYRQASHQFRHGHRFTRMDPDDWLRESHLRRFCRYLGIEQRHGAALYVEGQGDPTIHARHVACETALEDDAGCDRGCLMISRPRATLGS